MSTLSITSANSGTTRDALAVYVHAHPTAGSIDQTIRVYGPFTNVNAAESLVSYLATSPVQYQKALITPEPTPIAAATSPVEQAQPTIPAPAPTVQDNPQAHDPSTQAPNQV